MFFTVINPIPVLFMWLQAYNRQISKTVGAACCKNQFFFYVCHMGVQYLFLYVLWHDKSYSDVIYLTVDVLNAEI